MLQRYQDQLREIGRMARLQTIYQKQLASGQEPAREKLIRLDSRKLETGIKRAYQAAALLLKQQEALLRRLPDRQEAQALSLCYHKGLTTMDAADVMGYSLRQFQRIKRRGMEHLEALL